uniref:YIP1 family member 3 n=1 Tax=Calcidiscus leptoporus TaxID=127549 RepID=A0A7S0JJG1_9EUKA
MPEGERAENGEDVYMRDDEQADSGRPLDFFDSSTAESTTQVSIHMDTLQGQMASKSSIGGAGAQESVIGSAGVDGAFGSLLQQNIATSMVGTMLRGAKEQAAARGLTSASAQLDALRPYFDVETREVKQRLLWSFDPRRGRGSSLLQQHDMYCPLMLAFSLSALLISGMKAAHSADPDLAQLRPGATLVGTALGASFSFWLGSSALLYALMSALQARIRWVQLCGVTGYSLAGVCTPLLGKLLLAAFSSTAFWLLLLSFGLASASAAGRSLASLADDRHYAVVIGVVCGLLNISCTLYLEWMYF